MKKIISALLLFSLLLSMLCGCQGNSQESNTDTDTTGTADTSTEENTTETSADSTEPFEEYAINITSDLMYLYKEPNYEAETVGILEKGAYIVVDETSHTFGGVPLRWAKLKGYDGWIILNYINDDDYIGEDWSEYPVTTDPSTATPETSETTQKPETDTAFKSYKIKVLNNCLSVYSQPKISSNYWLYDITDHRTITVVEEREVLYYVNYHSWARLESGGWVRLDAITDTAYNNTDDTTSAQPETTTPDTSIPDTTVPDTTKPDNSETSTPETNTPTIDGENIARNVYGLGNKKTQIINGVSFIWYEKYYVSSKDTTVTFNSFNLRYEKVDKYDNSLECDYDIAVSNDSSVLLYYQSYDKDDYSIENAQITLFDQNGSLRNGGLTKKAKGYGDFFHQATLLKNAKTVIIYPL